MYNKSNLAKKMPIKTNHLFGNVFIAGLANERKRKYEDISSTIAQRSQSIVVFLACSEQYIVLQQNILRKNDFYQTYKQLINQPAVSHNPRLTVLPSTTTFALKLSKTVGT